MAINFNYNYPQVAREAGFKLRQYKDGPIDWRIVGSIEIERLLQDQRLEQVDSLLAHLSEAPLATMLDTNILDSGIVKYFIVSQFAIQYLLFCRTFLDETIHDLREAHASSQMDIAKLRKSLTEANNEILQLNKKITQIEAIHEVVYPCHLCTKSFISNEALNIHITRRHATRLSNSTMNLGGTGGISSVGGAAAERRTDTPASINIKDREHNDLQLINAVKLELEIKQLKERLNNAERDIRERRAATSSNSRHTTPREPQKVLKSIAVQSELQETKEQDDMIDATINAINTENSEMRERKAQLSKLQAKIQEFESWRETQQANNEETIAEINRKLNEIVHTLEETKSLSTNLRVTTSAVEPLVTHPIPEDHNIIEPDNVSTLQRRGSPSVEDLERLLTQKVVEIGQKSAEKLEEFVHNMEANYKEKLEELEREIKKRDAAELVRENGKKIGKDETPKPITSTSNANILPRDITYTAFNPTESDSSLSAKTQPEPAKRMSRLKRNTTTETQLDVIVDKNKNSETYAINENKGANGQTVEKPKPRTRKIKNTETTMSDKKHVQGSELYSQSTESNRTFVKAEKGIKIKDNESKKSIDNQKENDSTDITENLSSESESESSSNSRLEFKAVPSGQKKLKQKGNGKEHKISRDVIKSKSFTRNDAQRLVNKRLIASGLDPKASRISTATMKRLGTELMEQRHKLKQKHPNFYATRNKIKKLVDKLCSTKLPAPVEDMLKNTKTHKPNLTYDISHRERDSTQMSSDVESFEAVEDSSTPIQASQTLRDSEAFKRRLDRILASPIRLPNVDHQIKGTEQLKDFGLHSDQKGVPIPLTRKRVMFNTFSPSATEIGASNDAEPVKVLPLM